MNSTDEDTLVTVTAQAMTDVSLALLLIVKALKQQPGFDICAFDNLIERSVRDIDPEKFSLTVSILSGVLDPKA